MQVKKWLELDQIYNLNQLIPSKLSLLNVNTLVLEQEIEANPSSKDKIISKISQMLNNYAL